MASSPTSYSERPPLQGYRRSITAPPRQLSYHERAGLSTADADSETLYTHPSVRIISFAPPAEAVVSRSSAKNVDADYPIDTIETLPWRSRTEDLAASGSMLIEKVRGSSWFLKRGSQFVYPLLRNSQCWCVDGESKFVWRKGKLQYYRLELPTTTEEEKAKVEELKEAFAKVLKFEKTPCPFKRGFHVDLPDDAITPRRKGKWTKKEGSLPNTPDSGTPSVRRTKGTRSWSLQAQSPLPVPESRRQSDHGFAKRLYATPPPRRDTLSGLRPGTPSSTASSEDVGQDYPDDVSEESTSADDRDITHTNQVSEELAESEHEAVENTTEQADKEEVESIPQAPTLQAQLPPESPSISEVLPDQANEEMPAVSLKQETSGTETPPSDDSFIRVEIPNEHCESTPQSDEKATEEDLGEPETESPADPEVLAAPEVKRAEDQDHVRDQSADARRIPPESEHDKNHTQEPALLSFSDAQGHAAQEVSELSAMVASLEPLELRDAPAEASNLEFSGRLEQPDGSHESDAVEVPALDMKLSQEEVASDDAPDDTASLASTTESFHTLASDEQPQVPDTEVDVAENTLTSRQFQHKRGVSEMTITASNQEAGNQEDELAVRPTTPRLIQSSASDDSWPDVKTPSNIQDGLRQRLTSRRSFSPIPSSSVFAPSAPNHGNHMTSVLLQKACNVALVKPIEVVVLVVHILARIAGGASLNDLLTGELFKKPEQHKRSSSFPDRISPHHDNDEDDYGVPLRVRARSSSSVAPTPTIEKDTDADSMFDLD